MKDLQTLDSITSRNLVDPALVNWRSGAVTATLRSEPLDASALSDVPSSSRGAQVGPRAPAREQVTPDWKPIPSEPREPKSLKKTRGFRTSPKYLQDDFRFRVLHEFGGRCIMLGAAMVEGDGVRTASEAGREPVGETSAYTSPSTSAVHVCDGPLDPAHLIPKAKLRDLGFPETVVFDHRNGVAACRRAHRRHDDGLERFPYELLPPSVFDFARDHDLEYLLDRLYPKKELA